MFEPLEQKARERGFQKVAGVDEAGRGPLAGPVVAACVVFSNLSRVRHPLFAAINDSKQMSPEKREKVYSYLTKSSQVEFAVAVVDVEEIDDINILEASLKAMRVAVHQLTPLPDYVLVDGNRVFKGEMARQAVVQGDARVVSIAAASIIAKVTRDRLMEKYHEEYPQYGFLKHKGYGTREHIAAILQYGPSPIHRKSFKVKELCQEV